MKQVAIGRSLSTAPVLRLQSRDDGVTIRVLLNPYRIVLPPGFYRCASEETYKSIARIPDSSLRRERDKRTVLLRLAYRTGRNRSTENQPVDAVQGRDAWGRCDSFMISSHILRPRYCNLRQFFAHSPNWRLVESILFFSCSVE